MNKALILVAIVLASACVSQPQQTQGSKDVGFKTGDGIEIHGTRYGNSSSGIILLHMLGKDRNSWKDFAEKSAENYTVLAIDLRGHGQSAAGKSWQSFTEDDFNSMILDVKAAKEHLVSQNVDKITVIGASIGANIALKYANEDKEIRSVVLLSPGYDYRGVNITGLSFGRPVLLVASEDDAYSADTAKYLYFFASGKKFLVVFKNAGHGTDMLGKTNLTETVLLWLGTI